ncbi:ribbon-helix-helix domain-containing protein (plasmid) [Rhodococcus sp. USK10]|uniref:ribbon-helix-helix domain-containing protein n=1 Tax=Rhodococcus sp. USK10 TaxID=2789739 RepID=UPI001C5CCA69|nr:CopG family transcriptional regulator [Rhodococcus sp. USK10]QYA99876.1 ribbon-helix-helix domain-containing protein [Rhodococcus sp. USK10]
MSETNMGRVPVGDPIPLRFDPTTKQRLEEYAAGIGPRRFGALVRVAARRLLADPDRVPQALTAARRASAEVRRIPWAERPLNLDPATRTRLNELARELHTDRSTIVRVAVHRFLTAAGRFRHPVLREDARTDLTTRTRVYLNRSTLDRLERLISRHGDAPTAAAIRVAVRRLLDEPGDLAADLTTIGAARDLKPETFGARSNVNFDDDLRDQLDNLAERLDSNRAELMRLAARQLLANPRDLDQAVTEEIYRGDANRATLLARDTRRRQAAAADQLAQMPLRAPSPQGNPFGKRHVFMLDEDTKRRLEELADEYGPRRVSALLRVGIRRLIGSPCAEADLAQARRVAAQARTLPHDPVTLRLDSRAAARFGALAARYEASPRDLVAVAVHRFLTAPGHYKAALIDEAGASRLDERITVSLRPSALRDIERLADRHGTRLSAALVRVAVRRLLDDPGDLTGDLETVAPVHDQRPAPRTAQVGVALDDELLVHLDALAARLGSDRQELVYLAAKRILRFHHNIENRMLDEMFRAPISRKHLLAKHARREKTRRTDRGSGT